MEQISYSKVSCLLNECPAKYEKFYIRHIPIIEKKSIYGAFGTAFHNTAEKFIKEEDFDKDVLIKSWEKQFKKATTQPDVETINESRLNYLENSGYPLLSKYFSKEKEDNALKPAIELEKGFKVIWNSEIGKVLITGRIDKITEDDGVAEITDYKTNMTIPDPVPKMQMVFYSLAYRCLKKKYPEKYKLEKHKVTLFYVRHKKKITFDITNKDYEELKETLYKYFSKLKKYRKEGFPVAKTKEHCKYCGYKGICSKYEYKDLKQFKLEGFKKELRDYQLQDVNYLYNKGNALNANDMGLGKTVETIFLGEFLKKNDKYKSVLVITPNTLKYQWIEELNSCVKNPDCLLIDGGKHKRKELYKKKKYWNIVNYEMITKDCSSGSGKDFVVKLNNYYAKRWDLIVIDEGQRIKNLNSQVSKVVKQLKADRKIALSGTFLQNKLEELYSIMQFIDPSIFGNYYSFTNRYLKLEQMEVKRWMTRPIHTMKGMIYKKVLKTFRFKKIVGYKNLSKLNEKLRPHMIRHRLGEVVLDLKGKKNIIFHVVELTEQQKILYDNVVNNIKGIIDNMESKQNKKISYAVLAKLTYLREICDSAELVNSSKKYSSKLNELLVLINDILPNKVIIFSQYKKMIDIIQRNLKEKRIRSLRITGQESNKQREEAKRTFNNSNVYKVLLMTDAGQLGLNLQAANYVINFDIPFNPTIISQRIGRAYRIGQENVVTVINLITKNTIEDRIRQILYEKQELIDAVIDGSDKDEIKLSESDRITYKTLSDLLKENENNG